eukprot:CAMPEP_0204127734 /NCGR_PEP_ID=MMETSP0361-20130328/11768_1 /ASSEMBLY_ACC=CAM_ASM_000343 /TAXON_ID=268821 /ORGANISM="Scrippsiella Hangoei, Strain SHTV-5" /LENGTH=160 /DNA_ID=CAMNT_0051079837 /DNA_START=166 /DNA_END=649 /DNA_ORIENTATION=-
MIGTLLSSDVQEDALEHLVDDLPGAFSIDAKTTLELTAFRGLQPLVTTNFSDFQQTLLQDFSEHLQVEDAGLVAADATTALNVPQHGIEAPAFAIPGPVPPKSLDHMVLLAAVLLLGPGAASSATDMNRGSAAMLAFLGSVALDRNALTRTSQLKFMSMS